MVLVSNNPYAVDRAFGRGTRPRLDGGRLGVIVLGGFPRHEPRTWSTPAFELDAEAPVPAGADGEAVTLDPPLRFTIRHEALRVRISRRHPGLSPSALLPRGFLSVVPRLAHIALGRGRSRGD
jgi:hypothetical protein